MQTTSVGAGSSESKGGPFQLKDFKNNPPLPLFQIKVLKLTIISKLQEERQRALLQVQWKVMS